ncbi:hypothetical protein HK096_005751, partial [Nowakowskiella sp. JEL0078]
GAPSNAILTYCVLILSLLICFISSFRGKPYVLLVLAFVALSSTVYNSHPKNPDELISRKSIGLSETFFLLLLHVSKIFSIPVHKLLLASSEFHIFSGPVIIPRISEREALNVARLYAIKSNFTTDSESTLEFEDNFLDVWFKTSPSTIKSGKSKPYSPCVTEPAVDCVHESVPSADARVEKRHRKRPWWSAIPDLLPVIEIPVGNITWNSILTLSSSSLSDVASSSVKQITDIPPKLLGSTYQIVYVGDKFTDPGASLQPDCDCLNGSNCLWCSTSQSELSTNTLISFPQDETFTNSSKHKNCQLLRFSDRPIDTSMSGVYSIKYWYRCIIRSENEIAEAQKLKYSFAFFSSLRHFSVLNTFVKRKPVVQILETPSVTRILHVRDLSVPDVSRVQLIKRNSSYNNHIVQELMKVTISFPTLMTRSKPTLGFLNSMRKSQKIKHSSSIIPQFLKITPDAKILSVIPRSLQRYIIVEPSSGNITHKIMPGLTKSSFRAQIALISSSHFTLSSTSSIPFVFLKKKVAKSSHIPVIVDQLIRTRKSKSNDEYQILIRKETVRDSWIYRKEEKEDEEGFHFLMKLINRISRFFRLIFKTFIRFTIESIISPKFEENEAKNLLSQADIQKLMRGSKKSLIPVILLSLSSKKCFAGIPPFAHCSGQIAVKLDLQQSSTDWKSSKFEKSTDGIDNELWVNSQIISKSLNFFTLQYTFSKAFDSKRRFNRGSFKAILSNGNEKWDGKILNSVDVGNATWEVIVEFPNSQSGLTVEGRLHERIKTLDGMKVINDNSQKILMTTKDQKSRTKIISSKQKKVSSFSTKSSSITLIGSNYVVLYKTTNYTELGVSISQSLLSKPLSTCTTDLKTNCYTSIYDKPFNNSNPGIYTVTYTYHPRKGAISQNDILTVNRIVHIREHAPVASFAGFANLGQSSDNIQVIVKINPPINPNQNQSDMFEVMAAKTNKPLKKNKATKIEKPEPKISLLSVEPFSQSKLPEHYVLTISTDYQPETINSSLPIIIRLRGDNCQDAFPPFGNCSLTPLTLSFPVEAHAEEKNTQTGSGFRIFSFLRREPKPDLKNPSKPAEIQMEVFAPPKYIGTEVIPFNDTQVLYTPPSDSIYAAKPIILSMYIQFDTQVANVADVVHVLNNYDSYEVDEMLEPDALVVTLLRHVPYTFRNKYAVSTHVESRGGESWGDWISQMWKKKPTPLEPVALKGTGAKGRLQVDHALRDWTKELGVAADDCADGFETEFDDDGVEVGRKGLAKDWWSAKANVVRIDRVEETNGGSRFKVDVDLRIAIQSAYDDGVYDVPGLALKKSPWLLAVNLNRGAVVATKTPYFASMCKMEILQFENFDVQEIPDDLVDTNISIVAEGETKKDDTNSKDFENLVDNSIETPLFSIKPKKISLETNVAGLPVGRNSETKEIIIEEYPIEKSQTVETSQSSISDSHITEIPESKVENTIDSIISSKKSLEINSQEICHSVSYTTEAEEKVELNIFSNITNEIASTPLTEICNVYSQSVLINQCATKKLAENMIAILDQMKTSDVGLADLKSFVLVEPNESKGFVLVKENDPKGFVLVEQNDPKGFVLVEQNDPKGFVLVEQKDPKGFVLVEQNDPKGFVLVDESDPKDIVAVEQNHLKGFVVEHSDSKEFDLDGVYEHKGFELVDSIENTLTPDEQIPLDLVETLKTHTVTINTSDSQSIDKEAIVKEAIDSEISPISTNISEIAAEVTTETENIASDSISLESLHALIEEVNDGLLETEVEGSVKENVDAIESKAKQFSWLTFFVKLAVLGVGYFGVLKLMCL